MLIPEHMTYVSRGAAALALLAALAAPARGEPRTYQVQPNKSRLVVHLLKEGIGAALAHEHVVRATAMRGAIRLDPAQPGRSSIQITVDARKLEVDEPGLRRRYGLDPISAADREKVRRHMHGADQLYTRRFPRIAFSSSRVTPLGGDRYRVRGTLTIRGKSRSVQLDVRSHLQGDRFKGSGQLKLKQSRFGYKPYSAGLGAVRVKDRAILNIYLEARRSGGR